MYSPVIPQGSSCPSKSDKEMMAFSFLLGSPKSESRRNPETSPIETFQRQKNVSFVNERTLVSHRTSPTATYQQSPVIANDRRSSLNTDSVSMTIDRRSSLITARNSSRTADRRSSLITDRRSSITADRRSSIITDRIPSITADRRSSLTTDRMSSITANRRFSLNIESKSSVTAGRRSSPITGRRSSMISEQRLPQLAARRSSLMTDRMSSLNTDRRHSLNTDQRSFIVSNRRSSLVTDQSSSSTVTEGKVTSTKLAEMRYTVISTPKEIHAINTSVRHTEKNSDNKDKSDEEVQYNKTKETRHWITQDEQGIGSKLFSSGKLCLNSPLSGMADDRTMVDINEDNTVNEITHYRPKACWCLRCQIMLWMFNSKDERLAVWGNYPCFRR